MRVTLLILFSVLFLTPLQAALISYGVNGTAVSSAGSSGPVRATVQFETTNSGIVIVRIWNEIAGATRDIQAISAVEFKLSGGQSTGTLIGGSGIEREISSTGAILSETIVGDTEMTTNWNVSPASSIPSCAACFTSGLDLTTLNGGRPAHTIIGAANGSTYTQGAQQPNNAFVNHNPFLVSLGPAQWVEFRIQVTGVTTATTVTDAKYFFGTDRTAPMSGIPSVPEPSTWALCASGAFALVKRSVKNR